MKKIRIIDEAGKRFDIYADDFALNGRCLQLFRDEHYADAEIARPQSRKLFSAYWGITGFEVLEE